MTQLQPPWVLSRWGWVQSAASCRTRSGHRPRGRRARRGRRGRAGSAGQVGCTTEQARPVSLDDLFAEPVGDVVAGRAQVGCEVEDGADHDLRVAGGAPLPDLVEQDLALALLEPAQGVEDDRRYRWRRTPRGGGRAGGRRVARLRTTRATRG